MAKGKTGAGKKTTPSAGVGAPGPATEPKQAKVRAECSKAFELFAKKGNLVKASKELDKLVLSHVSDPVVRFARVRVAHCDALDQKRPDGVRKKFTEAKAFARDAIAACPDSFILKAMLMQIYIDFPIQNKEQAEEDLQYIDRTAQEMMDGWRDAFLEVGEGFASGFASGLASRGEKTNAAAAEAPRLVAFTNERTAVAELDKDVHSMYLFPRNKGSSLITPNVFHKTFLRVMRATKEKIEFFRNAHKLTAQALAARDGDAEVSAEDLFVDLYSNARDSQRKRYREDGLDEAEELAAKREALVRGARQDAEFEAARLELGIPPASGDRAPMDIDVVGDDGAAVTASQTKEKSVSKNVTSQARGGDTKTDRRPSRPSDKKKEEKVGVPLALVRRFWKTKVEEDPRSVLDLTDVGISELRGFLELKKVVGTTQAVIRKEITKRVNTGKWQTWRCGGDQSNCVSSGEHDTELSCFQCVQTRVPRDVLRDVSGDAATWLSPFALCADIKGLGAQGLVSETFEATVVSETSRTFADTTSTLAMTSMLATSKLGESLTHETRDGALVFCEGCFFPTPGDMALAVTGDKGKGCLLSADSTVLFLRGVSVRTATSLQALSQRTPSKACDALSPEYEFGLDARWDSHLLADNEKRAREVRVLGFEDALGRLCVDGVGGVDKLREHALCPGVFPSMGSSFESENFLDSESTFGFQFAETHDGTRRRGFAVRVEDWQLDESIGFDALHEQQTRMDEIANSPAVLLKQYVEKRNEVRDKVLMSCSGAQGDEKKEAPVAPSGEKHAAIDAQLAPVEEPEFVYAQDAPSWVRSGDPDDTERTPMDDILTTLTVFADASVLPLRLVQAVARYVGAVETKSADKQSEESADCLPVVSPEPDTGSRRRTGAGAFGARSLGVLGAAERVLSDSPETKDAVGRPERFSGGPGKFDVVGDTHADPGPVRLDDLLGRLRKLKDDDLKPVWEFCKQVWQERAASIEPVMKLNGLVKCDPDLLSLTSPVFGVVVGHDKTTGPDTTGTTENGNDENDSAVKEKESKKKKSGAKSAGQRGAVLSVSPVDKKDEWVPNEQSHKLRVSRGVWRDLYGAPGGEDTTEPFFGERLLGWLFHDAGAGVGELGLSTVSKSPSEDSAERAKKTQHVLAKIDAHSVLFKQLLEQKLLTRGLVDAVLVITGRLVTEPPCVPTGFASRAFMDLDHASEADAEKFVTFWRRHAFLSFHVLELRKTLMHLDIAEIQDDDQALVREQKAIQTEYSQSEGVKKKSLAERDEADKASKRLGAKKKSDAELLLFHKAQARRIAVAEDCDVRQQELQGAFDELNKHIEPVHRAHLQKVQLLQQLESSSEIKDDVVTSVGDDGSFLRKCSVSLEEKITTQRDLWIQHEGELPDATFEVARSVSRIPFRLSHLLCLATERLVKLDLQMEIVRNERVEAVTFVAETLAVSPRHGANATQTLVRRCVRERLENQAQEFATAEREADAAVAHAKMMEEEDLDSEAARKKEEKAKAKKAKEKAKAQEAKDAASLAEAELRAKEEGEKSAAEAILAGARDLEKAKRDAERKDAEALEDAALAKRREQILRETAQRQEMEHALVQDAERVSRVDANTDDDARRAKADAERDAVVAGNAREDAEQHALRERARERVRGEARSKAARAAEEESKCSEFAADADRQVALASKASAKLNAAASDFTPRPKSDPLSAPTLPPSAFAPPAPRSWGGELSPPSSPAGAAAEEEASAAAHLEAVAQASAAVVLAKMMAVRAAAARDHASRAAAAARAELAAVDSAPSPFSDVVGSWPTLLPAPSAPVVTEPEEDVDDHGFGMDDLEAALRASMTETKGRPKTPRPLFGDESLGQPDFGDADGTDVLDRTNTGGLRNLEGEYNCFLNVVIQSLWHLDGFRNAMAKFAASSKAKRVDADVATALRDVFGSLDAARDETYTKVGVAAAPNALRKALSALTDTGVEESLFKENEMADASEALQAIFHAVHRACEPETASAVAVAIPTPNENDEKTRGAFLDKECSYLSSAHVAFGLDIEERVTCVECGLTTHNLRYTKFLHLLPVTALNATMANEGMKGVDTTETETETETTETETETETETDPRLEKAKEKVSTARAIKLIDALDLKSCDSDEGGCGVRLNVTHLIGGRTPDVFVLALTWETASADTRTVQQTLQNLDLQIDLATAFSRAADHGGVAGVDDAESCSDRTSFKYTDQKKSSLKYNLRCVLCYYGEHYCAFAVGDGEKSGDTEQGGGGGWTLFDDATTKPVGTWADVSKSCEKGRLQPCVLFYERDDGKGKSEK